MIYIIVYIILKMMEGDYHGIVVISVGIIRQIKLKWGNNL